MRDAALSIQNELSDYGLARLRLRPFNSNETGNFGVCPWSSIRYEPDEETAARKLKSIVEKAAPNQTWDLLLLDIERDQGTTPGYISLFVEDAESFKAVYSSYGEYYENLVAQGCAEERRQ